MTELIVLLRGINVGSGNRISMAALREVMTDLGYQNPRTLLQSGNVVANVTSKQAESAAEKIQKALLQANVRSTVMTRTAAELRTAISQDPLLDVATDGSKHLIGFLEAEPSSEAVASIQAIDLLPDEIHIVGRHVYLWMTDGVLKSRLSTSGWEKMLGTAVTARNINTVTKLEAMLAD